ncbi:hypothetical protein [Natrononativus amylolyticus]|uniref:hypothetical protein n=1 Tax=Natrononativus amylolyticus TaxID=2963434 RepID=UPI0020CF15A5|nr:hypothetical protein [Natrononativus amylolyticus]
MTLADDGVVDSYYVEGVRSGDDERHTSEYAVDIERGATDLEEPPWLEESKTAVGSEQ